MECKNLIKLNHNVYMIDSNDFKLDLENDMEINKYEKSYKVKVIDLVNNFLITQDENYKKIISDIEELVKKYNIDYFMFGEGKQVSTENLALMYNLKNRNSCVDCSLKVFYSDGRYKHEDKIKCMIEFSEGSSGNNFGFSFYKYFSICNFLEIKSMLEQYFSSNADGNSDRKLINQCIKNIQSSMDYYYS